MTDTQVGKGVAQALADFQAAHKLTLENIALRQQLAESKALSAYRGQQLAEKVAEIERLRDAIWTTNKFIDQTYSDLVGTNSDYLAARYVDSLSPILSSALALPQDNTALREMIAKAGEVMRERCKDEAFLHGHCIDNEIRALPGVTLENLQ